MRRSKLALTGKAGRFFADSAGNFTTLFAVSIVPMILIVGLGIDYFTGLSFKARIDQASDAAAIAAVNTATNYVKTNSTSESGETLYNDAIAAGLSQASKAFSANLGIVAEEAASPINPRISLVKQANLAGGRATNVFQAQVTYATQFKTAFGPMVGVSEFGIQGHASAAAQFPEYMDIYFLIDASGSMGIGATDADQAAMQKNVGCTVGCHSPWNGSGKFWPNGTYPNVRAITPKVTMRIDVVRAAVINELNVIKASTFNGQIRVAIYLFSNGIQPLYNLSSDIDGAIQAASGIDIIGAVNQGGTYATYSLDQFKQLLPPPGDGTSTTSRTGSVLLFTDGIQDDASPQANGGEINSCSLAPNYIGFPPGSNCDFNIQGFNANDCAGIKTLGYTLYTLDFIYYVTSATMATDGRYQFIGKTLNPSVKSNMAACASSPANAVYAMTPEDFDQAISTLILQVLANVKLTQ